MAKLLGDIVLAQGVCAREAAEKGVAVEDHATHLIVHGTLHLLGYDHETGDAEAEAMEAIERQALASLGIADPYRDHRGRIAKPMEDRQSRQARAKGADSGGGLRGLLFGDGSEPTLRDQIEEAIESMRAKAISAAATCPVERQMLRNLLHFGEQDRRRCRGAARRHHRRAARRPSFAELVAAFAEAGHSRLPVYRGQPRSR